MMAYPPTRFEDILEDCITAIQSHGHTIAECLERYPAQREALEPLLRLAVRLQAARTLEVTPEFQQVAATRMRNLINAHPRDAGLPARVPSAHPGNGTGPGARIPLPRRRVWPWQARLRAGFSRVLIAGAVLLVSLFGGGAVYASNDALPGDTLYPVKRTVETLQLSVAPYDGALRIRLAERRLDEAAALLQQQHPERIHQALSDYAAQVNSVRAFLDQQSTLQPDEQAALADTVIAAQAQHEAQLATLLSLVPATQRPAVNQALSASHNARNQALSIANDQPGGVPTLALPPTVWPSATTRPSATVRPTTTSRPTTTEPLPTPTRRQPTPTEPSPMPTNGPLVPTEPPPSPTEPPPPTEPAPTPTRPLPAPPTAPPAAPPTVKPTERPAPALTPTSEPPEPPAPPPETPVPWPGEWPTVWPTSPPGEWPTTWPTSAPGEWPTAWPTSAPSELPTPPRERTPEPRERTPEPRERTPGPRDQTPGPPGGPRDPTAVPIPPKATEEPPGATEAPPPTEEPTAPRGGGPPTSLPVPTGTARPPDVPRPTRPSHPTRP